MDSHATAAVGAPVDHDLPVWLTLALALLLGTLLEIVTLGRTSAVEAGGERLAYPSTWVRTPQPGAVAAAIDLGGGAYGARVALELVPKEELVATGRLAGQAAPTAGDAAQSWSLRRAGTLPNYRLLGITPARAAGREAARIEYAYVLDPPQGAASGALPAVMHAVDTLIEDRGQYAVLAFAAEAGDYARLTTPQFPRFRSTYDDILAGWQAP